MKVKTLKQVVVTHRGKIEAVTFDGAGGGTGMSPVPMMDEMSTPTVYLETQVLKCTEILRKKGRYVPDIVMVGTRKWRLDLLGRTDLVALTERASKTTGIPLVEEAEEDAIERILS